MEIKNKAEHDPVADRKMVDAYVRWALLAAEEVVGKQGMNVVLREAGLERLSGNYPPNELKPTGSFTHGDYANLNAALLNFFGRAGKSMVLRIGRISAKHGIEQQGAMFGLAALIASKLLPFSAQIKIGAEAMQDGFRKVYQTIGQEYRARAEDRGDKIAYITSDCPVCAGKHSSEPICWIHTGVLLEGVRWQTGKEAVIQQTASRAMGAPECVWEVSKTPKE